MVRIGRRAGEFGNATTNRIGATGNEHAERVKIEQLLARQQRERRARGFRAFPLRHGLRRRGRLRLRDSGMANKKCLSWVA